MKKYPDKAQAFLDRYGDNQLAPEIMVVDGLFCSVYGILDTDDSSYWQAFVSHPYDYHPLTHITYSILKRHSRRWEWRFFAFAATGNDEIVS